ncbi:hypothetical protein TNCV_1113821 [Trichonephila clavipes]|nr:hypothetical protein TNCV_1113821 [Trichonephila clavipes]
MTVWPANIIPIMLVKRLAAWHSWFVTRLIRLSLRFPYQPKSVDFHDAESRQHLYHLIYGMLKTLQCLFSVGALSKIKLLVLHIVRAQVPPSGEETRYQNYIAVISIHLYDATLKHIPITPGECSRSAMVKYRFTAQSRRKKS